MNWKSRIYNFIVNQLGLTVFNGNHLHKLQARLTIWETKVSRIRKPVGHGGVVLTDWVRRFFCASNEYSWKISPMGKGLRGLVMTLIAKKVNSFAPSGTCIYEWTDLDKHESYEHTVKTEISLYNSSHKDYCSSNRREIEYTSQRLLLALNR